MYGILIYFRFAQRNFLPIQLRRPENLRTKHLKDSTLGMQVLRKLILYLDSIEDRAKEKVLRTLGYAFLKFRSAAASEEERVVQAADGK